MANLPSNRTKLQSAASDQSQSITPASGQKNREALIEAYDTIDLLNQKVDNLVPVGAVTPAPPAFLFQQIIINSDPQVWQRGASFAVGAGGQYTADRWFARRFNSSLGGTVSRQAGNKSRYCLRMQRDSGNASTDYFWIAQLIETANVIPLRGKKVTLSFRARMGSNYSGPNAQIVVKVTSGTDVDGTFFASTGNINGAIDAIGSFETLTTSWQDFSITSSSIDAAANLLSVYFRADFSGAAGANDYIEIEQIQLSVSDVELPYQPRHIAETAELCSRYTVAMTDSSADFVIGDGFAASTTSALITIPLPCEMRIQPTLIATPSDWRLHDGVNNFEVTDMAISGGLSNNRVATINCTVASGLTQFRPLQLRADGTANRLMIFDSEL